MNPSVYSVEFRDAFLSMQVVLLVAMKLVTGPFVWPEKLYNAETPRTLLMGIVVVPANGSCTQPSSYYKTTRKVHNHAVPICNYMIVILC